jgi:uncharacterized membrane protein HdeD (DUF308 family)
MAKQKTKPNATGAIASILATQGVIVALFGILALGWPGLTAQLFIALFGVFILVWGLIGLVHSFLNLGRSKSWWVELAFSVIALGFGAFLLGNPGVTGAIIILIVGFTLIIRGVIDIVTGLSAKDPAVRSNRLFYIVIGLLGVIVGIIVAMYPATSGITFVWVFGLYLLTYGVLNVALAFRLRQLGGGSK